MNDLHGLDNPIKDPNQDRCGMTDHAQIFAERLCDVSPPFTVGVYGDWGSGKTSFVHLVRHYLEQKETLPGRPIRFIEFSAAPYATSDKIWRALIVKIARAVYEVEDTESEPGQPSGTAQPKGLLARMGKVLNSPAIDLRKAPPPLDPHPEYTELMAKLDQTAYGGIIKNPEKQEQVEDKEALAAVVKAAMSALGTVSPLAALTRDLFGTQFEGGLMKLLHEEKNKATREAIRSAQDFNRLFKQMVEEADCRVFVFVDDLDRCAPDAVLDVLEAIRVVTEGVPCIFIFGANRRLIEQGLSLRYRDLAEGNEPAQAVGFFERMSKEYFEKYVQLGVPVPSASPELAHRFIADQFPEWALATDIMQVAIGTNPRRLKQQCNLLSYIYSVALHLGLPGLSTEEAGEKKRAQLHLLRKMIKLGPWRSDCQEPLCQLANKPDDYQDLITKIEALLLETPEGGPVVDRKPAALPEAYHDLYHTIAKPGPLRDLFLSEPRFSSVPASDVETIAQFIDVTPDPHSETGLRTRDGVLMRILERMVEIPTIPTVSPEALLQKDLVKLLALDSDFPEIAKRIFRLARSGRWTEQCLALEAHLDPTVEEPAGNETGSIVPPSLLELIETAEGANGESQPRQLFLKPPRFSSILPDVVQMYAEIRAKLPAAKELLSEQSLDHASLEQKRERIAQEALARLPQDRRQAAEASLELRITAAQYFLSLRRVAKLHGLAYRWPQLAARLKKDRKTVDALEAVAVASDRPPLSSQTQKVQDLHRHYSRDEDLPDFWKLHPGFVTIWKDEIAHFFQIAEQVEIEPLAAREEPRPVEGVPAGMTMIPWQIPAAAPSPVLPGYSVDQEATADLYIPGRPPDVDLAVEKEILYQDISVCLTKLSNNGKASSDKLKDAFSYYELGLDQLQERLKSPPAAGSGESPNGNDVKKEMQEAMEGLRKNLERARQGQQRCESIRERSEIVQRLDERSQTAVGESFRDLCSIKYHLNVSTPSKPLIETDLAILWPEVWDRATEFDCNFRGQLPTRDVVALTGESRRLPRLPDVAAQLKGLGAYVVDRIFPENKRAALMEELRSNENFRLLLEITEPELMLLPWEHLYFPQHRTFPALTQKYSLVRHYRPTESVVSPTIEHPLRILALLANPGDTVPLSIREERYVLDRTLAPARETGLVRLEYVEPPTPEELQRKVRRFQPHVLHFAGHGTFDVGKKQGLLILDDGKGNSKPLYADDLKTLLVDFSTDVAVLNACFTGAGSFQDAFDGVAGTLLRAGVPAVLATLQNVTDQAALTFVREFYTSLVEGYGLEASITEARKALSVEKLEWFAYALFASSTDLSSLRITSGRRLAGHGQR